MNEIAARTPRSGRDSEITVAIPAHEAAGVFRLRRNNACLDSATLTEIKAAGAVWNSFKSTFLLLLLRAVFNIGGTQTSRFRCQIRELFGFMIVCSCNVLSDHDVRSAVHPDGGNARSAGEVYGCLGCSAQCGRCVRTIKKIMNEALCPTSCGHAHAGGEHAL